MPDPTRCPLCGASNQCTQAEPSNAAPACWCFEVTIEPERLRSLPETLRDRACLCPRCAGVVEQLDAEQGKG